MRVFGEGWNPELERSHVPLDRACIRCNVPFVGTDSGIVLPCLDPDRDDFLAVCYHQRCFYEHLGFGLKSQEPDQ